jgi:hypothetical protein
VLILNLPDVAAFHQFQLLPSRAGASNISSVKQWLHCTQVDPADVFVELTRT